MSKTYINVGALHYLTGRFETKSELKKAVEIKADVIFDQTSMVHNDSLPGQIELDDLQEFAKRRTDWELSVVGPDPYSNRRWYAMVYVGRNGTVKVR